MENLQNEVSALLEKCAKYKVGQTVYVADTCTLGGYSMCNKAEIQEVYIDYDLSEEKYIVKYLCSFMERCYKAFYREDNIFSTISEVKAFYRRVYTEVADMLGVFASANSEEEELGRNRGASGSYVVRKLTKLGGPLPDPMPERAVEEETD